MSVTDGPKPRKITGNANLEPERGALADGGELRGLEVREAERGEVAVLLGKRREAVDHDGELLEEEREGLADEDEVCVAEVCMSLCQREHGESGGGGGWRRTR